MQWKAKASQFEKYEAFFQFDNAVEHFKTFVVTVQFYQEKREMSCMDFQEIMNSNNHLVVEKMMTVGEKMLTGKQNDSERECQTETDNSQNNIVISIFLGDTDYLSSCSGCYKQPFALQRKTFLLFLMQ